MRTLLLALLALPSLARADGAVLLFPAIGSVSRVSLTGRVFKNDSTNGRSTLEKNARRLLAINWEDALVEVRFAGQSKQVVSNHDGNFVAAFEVDAPRSFAVGNLRAEALVKGARTAVAIVEIVAPTAPFFVVSDFDDTVAVSQVLERRKLLVNVLLKDESSQSVVPGMSAFYGCLRDNPVQPAFALVSGSPMQLAPRVATFLVNHRFPPMGLYLRDLGPGSLRDYKQPVIRALLRAIPNNAVLVGDSGEHDPEIYRQMAEEFPDRILRVYIRNAGRSEDARRFEGQVLFDHPKHAALDAVEKGFATKECVARAFP